MAVMPEREPVTVAESERKYVSALGSLLETAPGGTICLVGPDGERVRLPASLHRLLARMTHELARGNAVAITPVHTELTTQQAADLLNVSRPFLVQLLESGAIPFHRVGTHRRVRLQDVLAYREERSRARRSALTEMAREVQELGLYE